VRKSDAARVTDLIKAIYGVKVSPFPAVDN